jgi:predicted MPP superfamily phosphohydrolase
VAVTGDILDEDISSNHRLKEILTNLQARHGVHLVTGNHEFYHGLENFLQFISRTPFKILRNEFTELSPEITLIGLDDPEIQNTGKYLEKEENVFRDLKTGDFNILLYHRPNFFHRFADLGVDLQLSGHTHNGQMFPMELIVNLVYRYPWGLYRKGSSFLYTSCGTGIWGPRMRTFSRSEIVQIVVNPRRKPSPEPRQR